MGHHDQLPLRLGGDQQPDQLVEDRLRVEVLFGLVEDQRVPPKLHGKKDDMAGREHFKMAETQSAEATLAVRVAAASSR